MENDIIVSVPLDRTIIELIQTIPTVWQRYESDTLTSTQQKALTLLLTAELIEQRHSIKLREIANPLSKVVLSTFRVTGEYGLVEITDKLAAAVPDWVDSEGKLNDQVAWYRKYRKRGLLTKDPRKISLGKLGKLFG